VENELFPVINEESWRKGLIRARKHRKLKKLELEKFLKEKYEQIKSAKN
jgi:hypothetical protein